MIKHFKIKIISVIFLVITIISSPVSATASGFTADADITVSSVTYGDSTVDMTIQNGSTAESWTFDSGVFTVTDPGVFTVSSSDSSVYGIRATFSSSVVACVKNSVPGTSYLTLPTDSGEYTIEPIATNLSNAVTYNSACGAATCDSGYAVSDSGANAVCAVPLGGGTPIWMLQQQQVVVPAPLTTPVDEAIPATPDISPETPVSDANAEKVWKQILNDGGIIATGDVSQLTAEIGVKRNLASEANYSQTIVERIVKNTGASNQTRNAITNFITYGTPTTQPLGAGERAGVVNSFKSAFGKLPTTEEDWEDAIKIANGRWPSQISTIAEDKAVINFRKVYLRNSYRTNSHDDAAITVMAYGLRPAQRNLESEKIAIGFFNNIYGYSPKTAMAWDVVRAIAYSGATR